MTEIVCRAVGRRVLLLALGLVTAGWVVVAAAPAQAVPAPPELSITVDNGRTGVAAGDRLGYTITVTNLGTTPVRGLRVSQTVPPGASIVPDGSHPSARVSRRTLGWTLDVPATTKITVRSTLRVVDPVPPGLLRLATVACAATSAKGPPLVCATDSDLLPGGTPGAQQPVRPTSAASSRWWLVGSGVVVAAALGAALVVQRRRAASSAVRGQARRSEQS